MNGSWTVRLPNGARSIEAKLDPLMGLLTVAYDGTVIHTSTVYWMMGEVHRFERDGHAYALRVEGAPFAGRLALFVDGKKSDGSSTTAPAAPPSALQFVKELASAETTEIVGIEEYPLDNSFGDSAFQTERQVSKESTNECTTELTQEVSGKLGLSLLAAINVETAARLGKTTGTKIGERVTETQTLRFAVGPKSAVLYQVLWTRKVRTGEHLYLAGTEPITVPYRLTYGLSCEVRTKALPARPA